MGSVGSGSRTGASGFSGESGGSLMGGGEGAAGVRRAMSPSFNCMQLRCHINLARWLHPRFRLARVRPIGFGDLERRPGVPSPP